MHKEEKSEREKKSIIFYKINNFFILCKCTVTCATKILIHKLKIDYAYTI